MNPDRLERYILDHRERFDDQEPDPAVWDRIETRKAPVFRISWRNIAWKAAAVAAIFTASYFFHDYMSSRNPSSRSFADTNMENASPMVRELIEAEAYYTSMISLRKDEVFMLTADNPDIRHEIDREMVDLDRVYTELKEDLKDNADNEEVIEAMIQNYRIKLEILEEMLLELKQIQQSENEQDHENIPVQL